MLNTQVTYYELLEVSADADTAQILAAFKRKRRDAHPDKGGSSALWRLYEQAKQTLTDPVRRARYDAELNGAAAFTEAPKTAHTSPRGTDKKNEAPRPRAMPDPTPHTIAGPPARFYPVPGQPPAPDDPRLRQPKKRSAAVKIAMGAWWTLGALAIGLMIFSAVAKSRTSLRHGSSTA